MKNIHNSLLHIPRFLVAATAANPRRSPVASAAVREASGKLAITKKGAMFCNNKVVKVLRQLIGFTHSEMFLA